MMRPDVFVYDNHRQYLSDWYAWRKSSWKSFSHRAFATQAGTSNAGFLKQYTTPLNQGYSRRWTRGVFEKISVPLQRSGITETELSFLWILAQMETQPRHGDAYRRLLEERESMRALNLARDLGNGEKLFSRWFYPIILELVQHGCPDDPERIANSLFPPISTEEASDAIEVLLGLGLIARSPDGCLEVPEGTLNHLTVPTKPGALNNYYRESLDLNHRSFERAIAAGDKEYATRSRFRALVVSVSDEQLPRLRTLVTEYQKRILGLCSGAHGRGSVYQINFQMFPVTEFEAPPPEGTG